MNLTLTEMLLSSDINEFKVPEKELDIKRLSEIYKNSFIIKFRAIKADEEEEIQRDCMTITKDGVEIDSSKMKYMSVAKCILEPDIKNKELQKKFNAANYMELLKKLLLIGEVTAIYDQIQELSGYGKDKVEEIKNS